MSNLHNKTVELDRIEKRLKELVEAKDCLLYTSDAADE